MTSASVAGQTEFLKGCNSFKKDMIKRHASSNGHIRAREKSLAEVKNKYRKSDLPIFCKDKEKHTVIRTQRNGNQITHCILCSKIRTILFYI